MEIITVSMWIIGIALTVIFGVPSIISLFRSGKITFVKEDSICLFDAVIKNFPPLKISYNDSPIAQNLVLLKGAIVNTGSKDITLAMVEKDLEAQLPDNFKWLNIAIVDKSKDLKVSPEIKDTRTLVFRFGLFRRKEFVRFEALIEVPIKTDPKTGDVETLKDIVKIVVFAHRISDTRKVNKINVYPKENLPPIFGFIIFMSLIMAVSYFAQLKGWGVSHKLVYSFNSKENKIIDVYITPKRDDKVSVKGIKERYAETMNIQEFLSKTKGIPKTIKDPSDRDALMILIVAFIIICLPMLFFQYKIYKMQGLRRLLGI